MNLLINWISSVLGLLGFLQVMSQVIFGNLIWPKEQEMLESLKPDVWECAHHVRRCIAAKRQIEPERIQLDLLDWRLLRLERRGLVYSNLVPDPECPHDPPCGEYFYVLSESGQTRLRKLSRAPTSFTPEPLPA